MVKVLIVLLSMLIVFYIQVVIWRLLDKINIQEDNKLTLKFALLALELILTFLQIYLGVLGFGVDLIHAICFK